MPSFHSGSSHAGYLWSFLQGRHLKYVKDFIAAFLEDFLKPDGFRGSQIGLYSVLGHVQLSAASTWHLISKYTPGKQ
jgi:hypothetical protein